jgi:hypothetical protein
MSATFTCEYVAQPRHVKLVSLHCTSARDTQAAFGEVAKVLTKERECPVLADARLWGYRPSFEDVKQFATDIGGLGVFDGPFAMVVGDDLQFGIASQLAAMCAGHGVQMGAFKSMEEASAWLRL